MQVLNQICSTLFDYPAIRECKELVGPITIIITITITTTTCLR